jgi:hypothetical protein
MKTSDRTEELIDNRIVGNFDSLLKFTTSLKERTLPT